MEKEGKIIVIEEIKHELIEPRLLIYSTKEKCWGIIQYPFDIETTECINDAWQLKFKTTFALYDECDKYRENGCEYYVRLLPSNDLYIVKDIHLDVDADNVGGTLTFTCSREEIVLKGVYCELINEIAKTPEQLFNSVFKSAKSIDLANRYIWKGTDIPTDKKRSIKSNDR